MPYKSLLKPSEIKEARKRRRITQTKLAELCGVTQPYIAKIEAGKADPKLSILEKISEVLSDAKEESGSLKVGEIMTSPVICARPEDSVEKVVRMMESNNISQLPVVEGGVQVGSFAETTFFRRLSQGWKPRLLLKEKISEVMDEPLPSVSGDEDVDVLYMLLEKNPAVLVTEKGRVKGIVTKADLFKLRRYRG
ncbi:MAG: CBS domain-containing protein [Candidatus Hadarchaeales archaeon]